MLEVMRWFKAISAIPRESGNEKSISDFLVKWAKERKLEVYQDKAFNVIIKKEATSNYKNAPTVIIQGHMDMVCVKGEGSNHNFNTDPIEIIEEGDIVRANNTTLGADNGIAISYGLALLDSNSIEHPKIELICTASEETDMSGALSLENTNLTGKVIFNIDGEGEGIFLVSSAGGITPIVRFPIKREKVNNSNNIKISISGLKGGHSGVEINKQRANAIKILGRVLYSVKDFVNIVSINGGAKDNAIASTAECIINTNNKKEVENIIAKLYENIKNEYSFEDNNITVTVEDYSQNIEEAFSKEMSNDIIDFLTAVPYGTQYMFNNDDLKGIVKSSLNIGILREVNNNVEVVISIRSAEESLLEEINNRIKIIANRTNAQVEDTAKYPSWKFDPNSKLIEVVKNTYKDFSGKEPIITAIHAGLECGILKQLIPDADIISFGPNLFDVHTETEYFNKSSVERTWEYLKKLLSAIQ